MQQACRPVDPVAAECHPWQQKKICQKSGKRGKKLGKIRKFLSLCPSWQMGLATLLSWPMMSSLSCSAVLLAATMVLCSAVCMHMFQTLTTHTRNLLNRVAVSIGQSAFVNNKTIVPTAICNVICDVITLQWVCGFNSMHECSFCVQCMTL